MSLPKRLKSPPIVDMLCEIRFERNRDVVEKLPSKIAAHFVDRYDRLGTHQAAGIPAEVRDRDVNLRYLPTYTLKGSKGVINVGDRALSIANSPNYAGWESFCKEALELVSILESVGAVSVERYSLKSVNIVPADTDRALEPLKLEVVLGGSAVQSPGLRLHLEFREDETKTLIDVGAGAHAKGPSFERHGTIVTVDSICANSRNHFWTSPKDSLDTLHEIQRMHFFNLLRTETISAFGPEY